MRILALALLVHPAFAAITNITVDPGSSQAIIRYSSGNGSACTVVAGLDSSLSPALAQTDPAKFTGGLSDAQFSYLNAGQNRVIILGQKATVRGTADGVPYSLALPIATTLWFQLTCGVATSAVLSFVTDTAVMGQSYVDPIQADPNNPGEVLNPWFDLSKRQVITDPQTGLQVQNLSLPHDISVCGAACSSFTMGSGFVTANSPWAPTLSTYPYTITNNNSSYLALSAYGMHFWPPYPWGNPSVSYASDNQGTLNWAQFVVTGSSSGSGDVLTGCLSENGVSCDPWGTVITANVPTSSGDMTFGTGTTQYQGGWINAGNRFRNAPETNPRTGNAICAGTAVTLDQFTNHQWGGGTPITINGSANTIVAVTGDYTITTGVGCGTVTNVTGATNASPIVITDTAHGFSTGQQINIKGVLGNTAANGTWTITVTGANAFSLNGSSGNGAYTSAGTVAPIYPYTANSLWWLFKMQTATANTITITGITSTWEGGLGIQWPDGGFWGTNSLTSISGASSAPGYLVQIVGLGLYWFNSKTGAVSLIGDSNLTGGGFNGNLCQGNSATWDTTGAGSGTAILYCNIAGTSGVLKMVYSGSFADAVNYDNNTPNQFCGNPPCWTVTAITTSVDTLATSFNAAYGTLGTGKGMTANNIVGVNQHGELVLRSWATSSPTCGLGCPGWLVIFDPNKISSAAGCVGGGNPGCVVALAPTFSATGTNNYSLRGAPIKGSIMNNAGSGIVEMGPYFWTNTANNGGGPWQVGTTGGFAFSATLGSGVGQITTCPSNPFSVTGSNCTAVPVDGQPYDPNPGPNETGARGEYVTVTAGDYWGVGGDDVEPNGIEMVRVLIANMSSGTCGIYSSPCAWVQRGAVRDSLYCGPGGGVNGWPSCGYGGPPRVSAANVLLQYAVTQAGVFWDYLSDPMATTLVQAYDFDSRGHTAALNGRWVDCCSAQVSYGNNGCTDQIGQCYGMKTDPSSSTWNLLTRNTPVFDGVALQNPPFQGIAIAINGNCSGGGCGNSTQIHPSSPGGGGTADSNTYAQDSRPFNGFWITPPCVATAVSLTPLWVISPSCAAGGGLLHRKLFPTRAAWGWHPLIDGSGPNCTGQLTQVFTYGVVVNAGECHGGSIPGEIYFNVPWLTYPYSFFSGQSGSNPDAADITFVDNAPNLDAVVEFPTDDPSDRGRRSRVITHSFSPTKVNAPFYTVQTSPDNEWYLLKTRQFVSSRNEALMVKRPTELRDGTDRKWYGTPAMPVAGVTGTYAMIEFGNLEYGSDGATKFWCTTRRENCRTLANPSATVPFLFSGEAQSPTPCSSNCTVTPAFIPDRVMLYRLLRTDSAGNVLTTGSVQAVIVH